MVTLTKGGKFTVIVFFSLILFNLALGQNREQKRTFKEGKHYFKVGNYRQAVKTLTGIAESYKDDPKYHYYLGISYLHSLSYPKGLHHISTSYELDQKVFKDIHYWLGRANHLNYNFEEAILSYNEVLGVIKKEKKPVYQEVLKYIDEAKRGKAFYENPQNYVIRKLGDHVNTEYSEHSPVTTLDGKTLYFTSRKKLDDNDVQDPNGDFLERLFVTYRGENNQWTVPELLPIEENDEFRGHLATMQLSDNDSSMYLYKSVNKGDIYVSNKLNDSVWTEPKEVARLNTIDYEADVYFSRDASMMLMASDRGDKSGDLDLFASYKQANGKWSEPENLGDTINTKHDENSPYIANDGNTLYFSSKGHDGMGGYDIFKSERDLHTGRWLPPVNIGFPMNTPGDDIYFYYGFNGWTGIFSSYRVGGNGEEDLYEVTFVPNVRIKGRVLTLNEQIEDPRPGLKITFTPQGYSEVMDESISADGDGAYDVNILSNSVYNVVVHDNQDTLLVEEYKVPLLVEGDPLVYKKDFYIGDKPDMLQENDSLSLVAMKASKESTIGKEIHQPEIIEQSDVDPKHNKTGQVTDNNNSNTTPELFSSKKPIRNVYFDFNQWKIRDKSKAQLDKLVRIMQDNPGMRVSVEGHADEVGRDNYNIALSEKRAQVVVEYLVTQGIDKSRLTYKGWGEAKPLASNDDELDGRELNRRTEFILIKSLLTASR